MDDLQNRLGNIIVGYTREKKEITARDLNADGAMTTLLKDAFLPNLVQTNVATPVVVINKVENMKLCDQIFSAGVGNQATILVP